MTVFENAKLLSGQYLGRRIVIVAPASRTARRALLGADTPSGALPAPHV